MKCTIKRTFSLTNEKFTIISDSKTLCTAKLTPSKEYQGRYNIRLSNSMNKHIREESCIVEPDPNRSRSYLIYLRNDKTEKRILFGQLSYQFCSYNNHLYTIIIGQRLYQVRSSDLKDRRLTIIDTFQSTNSPRIDCPETLFQLNDPFPQSNKKYHLTINDHKWQYGYLAIVILLDLLENKRNIS